MLDFNNTEIAFQSKSDRELKHAHRLFNLLGKPKLQTIGIALTELALKLHLPINGIVKKVIFSHFCGGESITECDQRITELAKFNIGTILDYSIEGKETTEQLDGVCEEIIATINKAKSNKNIPFSVFKPTGVCQLEILEKANDPNNTLTEEDKQELAKAHGRIDKICRTAFEAKVPLFIDAEDYCMQDTIDRIAEAMMARYNKDETIVFNTLQMYRHDRIDYLKESHRRATLGGYKMGLKLVRGAYMEKERERAVEGNYPDPIQPTKEATDRDYDAGVKYCVENNIALCAGTHNEKSSLKLTELLLEHNFAKDDKRFYFAQLLGMSDHISFNLSNAGYNVVKYVPYGPVTEVMPYLIRRAEENTSVAGQTGRELSLIEKELERR